MPKSISTTKTSTASTDQITTAENTNLQKIAENATTLIANKKNKTPKISKTGCDDDDLDTKQGCFRRAIPTMPKPMAIICCVMNILLPGTGTLVAAFSVICCDTKHGYSNNIFAFLMNLCAFILQFCSCIIIFGWIWSIKYGLLFVRLTSKCL